MQANIEDIERPRGCLDIYGGSVWQDMKRETQGSNNGKETKRTGSFPSSVFRTMKNKTLLENASELYV